MVDEFDQLDHLRRWLPRQGAKTWHQVALTWNWDNGVETLNWILDQPSCDRGTAIALYLLGEPGFYAEKFASLDEMRAADHFGVKNAEFLAGICRRWADGAFPLYRYHPGYWWDRARLWDDVPPGVVSANAPWPVPATMVAAPLRGEAVDLSGFYEGMPKAWFDWNSGT